MSIGLTEFVTNKLAAEHPQVIPISVFIAILCLCLVIGHLLEENRWVNESITAILVVSFFKISSFFFVLAKVLSFSALKEQFYHYF